MAQRSRDCPLPEEKEGNEVATPHMLKIDLSRAVRVGTPPLIILTRNKMTQVEYRNIRKQIKGIEGLMPYYSGKTIDNILTQLKARAKEEEKRIEMEIEVVRFG